MLSQHQRALLPLIGLQGAIGSLGGFIGFFVVGHEDLQAMFRYTVGMLTAAMAATFITFFLGPRLRLNGRRLFRLGFLFPGVLLLAGDRSVTSMALAYGSFMGITWGARHTLEMSLLRDPDRDTYASHSVTISIMLSVTFTLIATLLLTAFSEQSRYVYWMYGTLCLLGAAFFGKSIPDTPPVALKAPLSVIRQPQFIACLPLFFLESGLFGISQAMASAGAVNALGSASHFGWVATLAGLVGGTALFVTRKNRNLHNRANWFGGASAVVGLSFLLLGASVWVPVLYIVYSVMRAAAVPFLSAGEQVLNQCTLDIHGELSDRIFAREFVLWALRMVSIFLFWGLAQVLSPTQLILTGSGLLAGATGMEYLIGKSLFWKSAAPLRQAA